MNSTCCICADLINPKSQIFSTSCGHLYHRACLFQWLKTSSTCPQCRHAESKSSVHRIFLNFTSSEGITDDPVSLQAQVDRIALNVLEKDKQIAELKIDCQKYRSECVAMKEVIKLSKDEERMHEGRLLALQTQLRSMRERSANNEDLSKSVDRLIAKYEAMQEMRDLIDGCQDQASEMLRTNKDPKSLNIIVTTLKKQLVSTKSCNRLLNLKLINVGKQLLQSIGCIDRMTDKKDALRKELVAHESCLSQMSYLRRKMQQVPGGSASSANCTVTSSDVGRMSTIEVTMTESDNADVAGTNGGGVKRKKSTYMVRSKFQKLSAMPKTRSSD